MKFRHLLPRWLVSVCPAPAMTLSHDEFFSLAQPERAPLMPPVVAIGDGEAWFHEVFSGAVF